MTLYQFDIKSAFLISERKDEIYVPGEYQLPKGTALKLQKLIYGLKNSAFAWSEHFIHWMSTHKFNNIDGDGIKFMKTRINGDGSTSKIIVGVHVNDGSACTNDDTMYEESIQEFQQDLTLNTLGKLQWNLGCQIEQEKEDCTVSVSQEKYAQARDVLKRFNAEDDTPVSTPCESNLYLEASDSPPMDKRDPEVFKTYQMGVGSCMYLSVQ